MPTRRQLARFLAATIVAAGGLYQPVHAADSVDGKLFTQIPEVAQSVGQPAPTAKNDPTGKKAIHEGPAPVWIWGPDPDKKYFVRKTF